MYICSTGIRTRTIQDFEYERVLRVCVNTRRNCLCHPPYSIFSFYILVSAKLCFAKQKVRFLSFAKLPSFIISSCFKCIVTKMMMFGKKCSIFMKNLLEKQLCSTDYAQFIVHGRGDPRL